MKKLLIVLILLLLSSPGKLYGYEQTGLQPLAPYGIFSVFSSDSHETGKASAGIGIERTGNPSLYRYPILFAYGLTDSMEINSSVAYVDRVGGAPNGFEDVSFGFKHRVFNEVKYGPSLAYLIITSIPSGREEYSTKGTLGAGIIISKKVGPFNGHANVIYENAGSLKYRDALNAAAGFDLSASSRFEILGEINVKRSHYSGEIGTIEGRFGYRFMTSDNILTTIGIGTDFKNRTPEYRLVCSISFLLNAETIKIERRIEE